VSDSSYAANRVETLALTSVFTVVTAALFFLLPLQTKSGPESAGWWTQPWLMPTILLSILLLANLVSLLKDLAGFRKMPPSAKEKTEAKTEILGWFRPLEFFAYFLGYLWSLAYLGYFLSTALFIQFLLYRVNLRTTRWRVMGLLAALALTAIFRWGLGIWVPTASLYDLFPDVVRKFLTRWF
jgi:hypothetical protein